MGWNGWCGGVGYDSRNDFTLGLINWESGEQGHCLVLTVGFERFALPFCCE